MSCQNIVGTIPQAGMRFEMTETRLEQPGNVFTCTNILFTLKNRWTILTGIN